VSLAVRVDDVDAFLEADRFVRIPLAPRPVAGLCTYRGGVLPILDPADDREGSGAGTFVVLSLRTRRGLLGLLVSRGEVVIVADGQGMGTGPDPAAEAGGAPLPQGLVAAGVIERDGETFPVIDPEGTWSRVREMIVDGYTSGRRGSKPTSEPGRDSSQERGIP